MNTHPSRIKIIAALGTGAATALLLLDGLLIAPLAEVFDGLDTERQRLESRLVEAGALLENQQRISKRWSSYEAAGLRFDADSARIRVQEQLNTWSRAAGLNVERLSSDRVKPGDRFDEIGFVVTGAGPIAAVQHFLFSLRQAPFALRINTCEIVSRNGDGDSLTLSLRLSTLVVAQTEPIPLADRGGNP